MELSDYRKEIDAVDEELVALFAKRMELSAGVAEWKREHGKRVLDSAREREKLMKLRELAPEGFEEYTEALYTGIFELSRCYQSGILAGSNVLTEEIDRALRETPLMFPQKARVCCQGVEGAYSQIACERLFRQAEICFVKGFEDVFAAIERGDCRYGIIPVENSTAGSVNQVYDLMVHHNFRIVKSVRVKVDHNLLSKKTANLEDIRVIYSHPQAIAQCSAFLHSLSGVEVRPCANTAVAAKMVAESEGNDIAALSSRSCIELYNLKALCSSIQDQGANFTRFICISKEPEIYPGADRSSLMAVLPHKPGALYRVLARMNTLGINLNKLESRPIPERNFEFRFYFDLDASVYSEAFRQLMQQLPEMCEEFAYLGSYIEII